jgi:thioesterase domain-containing protein
MVHGADGGVDYARAVARYLPGRFSVWGVQMEGYQGAPPPHRTIPDLAAMYVRELLDTNPSGGVVIVGYSIGGTLAFEMTRQLEAEGIDVALLTLIDSRFPPRAADEGRTPAVAALPRAVPPLPQRLWRRLVTRPFKQAVTNFCVRSGTRLPRFMGIRTRYFWRMLAAARDAYEPRPVSAPMLVLGAEGTGTAHEQTWLSLAETEGWVTEIPTDHLDLIREPHVQELSHNLHQAVVLVLDRHVGNGAPS